MAFPINAAMPQRTTSGHSPRLKLKASQRMNNAERHGESRSPISCSVDCTTRIDIDIHISGKVVDDERTRQSPSHVAAIVEVKSGVQKVPRATFQMANGENGCGCGCRRMSHGGKRKREGTTEWKSYWYVLPISRSDKCEVVLCLPCAFQSGSYSQLPF